MNANRKADLQRKLAVAPVPKPPAGLAERIKTEIPKELRFDVTRERARFARSLRLSLGVAASVIVIVSSAFLALRVMETADQKNETLKPAAATPILTPARMAAPQVPATTNGAPLRDENKPKLASKKQRQQKAPAAVEEQRSLDAVAKNEVAAPAAPAAAAATAKTMALQAIPFKDLSREEKVRILKDRLAHGADPKEIARAARESGLNDFADELEKKKP